MQSTEITTEDPSSGQMVARFHLQSNVDLSDLDGHQMMALQVSVSEFKTAGKRLAAELYTMTTQLAVMREILGTRFRPFAVAELGLNERTITRYLHLHKVLSQHFTSGDQLNLAEANAFSQRALSLLSPTTDEAVIIELKQMAANGAKIDEHAVRQIIEQHEEAHAAKLASTQAELTSVTKELERVRLAREVEQAKSERTLASNGELLRRAEQQKASLEEEIAALRKQATEVRFETKNVEVLPTEYATLQDAIAAKSAQLQEIEARREELERQAQAADEKLQATATRLQELQSSTQDFLLLKEQVDGLIMKFPVAMVKAMSAKDTTIREAVSGLGQLMVQFGNQLNAASA